MARAFESYQVVSNSCAVRIRRRLLEFSSSASLLQGFCTALSDGQVFCTSDRRFSHCTSCRWRSATDADFIQQYLSDQFSVPSNRVSANLADSFKDTFSSYADLHYSAHTANMKRNVHTQYVRVTKSYTAALLGSSARQLTTSNDFRSVSFHKKRVEKNYDGS
jgi:hypothetical protein